MQWLEMAVRLPAAAMQIGIKALSDIWGAVQGNAAQGVDGLVSQIAHGLGSRQPAPPLGSQPEGPSSSSSRQGRPAQCCLSNECLKLIRYQVLFVKRGLEVAFPAREELVWESMSGLQFQTWKVAEFVSELDDVPLPPKWLEKGYPPGKQQREIGAKQVWVIQALPGGDEKFLRVRCQVLRSYRREWLRYPEKQLEVLAEIRDAIALPVWTPSGHSSPVGLLADGPAEPARGEPSLLLATEQEYLAAVASQAGKAEAAQLDQPARPKKAKAGQKKKTSQKRAKAKPKKAAKAKKAARARKRSGA